MDRLPGPPVTPGAVHERMRSVADAAGLRRIQVLTMRAFDDPQRGGAEEHAEQVARHWAAAGIEVRVRAAAVPGRPSVTDEHGVRVVRRGGPLTVFPRGAVAARLGRDGPWDALLEVSHGLPFWAPVWTRRPHVLFVHHVLQGVWHLQAAGGLTARVGAAAERLVLPRAYRRAHLMAPSASTKESLVGLGVPDERIDVVHNGLDERFTPGGERSPSPTLVAVGRLSPQKGFDRVLRALARLDRPDVGLVVVGEGRARAELEALARSLGVAEQVTFVGRIGDDALVEQYRRSWLVVSGSHHEGWGLTLTEAAACATPCVATRIAGHVDAVVDGVTGVLVDDEEELADAVTALLDDPQRLARLGAAARGRAATLRWESVADAILGRLAEQARA